MVTGADLLNSAAYIAEQTKTAARAIMVGWSALHVEGPGNEWPKKPAMMAAFEAWCASEDVRQSYLGAVLRSRYKTPVEVARFPSTAESCGSDQRSTQPTEPEEASWSDTDRTEYAAHQASLAEHITEAERDDREQWGSSRDE